MMVWQGKHCLPSWHVLSAGHLFVLFFFSSRQRLVSLVSFVPGIPLGSLCVALRFPQMGHLHRNCWSEGTFRIPANHRQFVISSSCCAPCAHFVLGCLSFLLETHHGRCSLQAQEFAPEKNSQHSALSKCAHRIRNLLAKFGFIGRFLRYSDLRPWQVVRPL